MYEQNNFPAGFVDPVSKPPEKQGKYSLLSWTTASSDNEK